MVDEAWNPEPRPSDHEWWSEALWAKAVGGVSKGRMLGVAKGVVIHDAGYSERRGACSSYNIWDYANRGGSVNAKCD